MVMVRTYDLRRFGVLMNSDYRQCPHTLWQTAYGATDWPSYSIALYWPLYYWG